MSVTEYLIKNPIVKWMIISILFLVSFMAITGIKRFAYPRVDLNQMTITAKVPGFSIDEIELQVTHKINDKLKAIDGIKNFKSTSYPNYAFFFLEIDSESEVDNVKTKIRNEVSSISDFPSEMESQPHISEIKIDNKPTMILGITPRTPKNYDPLEFSHEALVLRDELRNSESVSLVYDDIPKKQIQILLNKDKMKEYQITFEEVYELIHQDQIRLSAGDIESDNEVKGMVTLSERKTPNEISNIILRPGGYQLPDSPIVKIKDIGKVVFDLPPTDIIYHINGDPGYKIEVVKKNQVDIIEFSLSMEKLIEKFQEGHPDFQVRVHENDSWETEQRLSIALNSGLSSLVLVAIVLFLFLKLSIAFWAIFEMPATILFSTILMWAIDITINNVSLCGIILTLGIIVDNPTVIGELTMYYIDKGYSPTKASLLGLQKILKPLIFSLLTTLASFASMFFIPGVLGDFAIEIPLTVSFMLISSFIESVFFLPSHLAHTRSYRRPPWGDRFLKYNKKFYHWALKNALKNPVVFLISMILIIGLATWRASESVNYYLFSTEQSNKIIIDGKTPSESNLDYTETQAKSIEKVIDKIPEGTVRSYITKIGDGSFNNFQIEIILTPFFDRQLNANQVREVIAQGVQKAELNLKSIGYFIDSGGPPSGKPIEINIFHPDEEVRKVVISGIMINLQSNSIFSEINTDYEEGLQEIQVIPKPEAYYSGISAERIARTLRFSFEGINIKEAEIDNQIIEWILKLDSESRNFFNPIDDLTITSPTGITTELNELVTLVETNSVVKIKREKGKAMNMVWANFDSQKNSSQKILAEFSELFRSWIKKYPELKITFGGEAKDSFDTLRQFILAILGSVLFIYMLLVIQFKNFTQPFIVVSSIPFGIAGIIITFSIQNTNISFLTMVGILGYGGVVVNSSIILIDFINSLRDNYFEHHSESNYGDSEHSREEISSSLPQPDIREIIIEGALARFRPILITTGSTVMGFIPLAYAIVGETDSIISPMSMGMIWGMLFGTTASLFVIPTLYLINENLGSFMKKSFQKMNN